MTDRKSRGSAFSAVLTNAEINSPTDIDAMATSAIARISSPSGNETDGPVGREWSAGNPDDDEQHGLERADGAEHDQLRAQVGAGREASGSLSCRWAAP